MAVTKFEKPMGTEVQSLSEQIGTVNTRITGNEIPANTDLNTISTPGHYYCSSDSNAGTISNKPINNSRRFGLDVEQVGTSLNYKQIFHDYQNNEMYIRTLYNGGVQNSWEQFTLNSKFAEVSSEVPANSNVTVAYPTGFNRSNSNAMMGYINISGNKYFDSTKAGIVFGSEGVILYNHDSSTRTIGCGIIRTT